MSDIAVKCPKCGAELEAPDELVGQEVECPACNATLTVPRRKLSLAKGAQSDESPPVSPLPKQVRCLNCGAPMDDVRAGCRACGLGVLGRQQPKWEPASGSDKQRFAGKTGGPQAGNPPPKSQCPKCKAEMAVQDLVCRSCGFDFRTGGRTPAPKTRHPASPQVSFVCPHCGVNLQGIASPGDEVRCDTCGGTVIVPGTPKLSPIVVFGGGFLLVCFAIAILGSLMGVSGGKTSSNETASDSTVSAVYALGAEDARATYGRSDKETALQASKIVRRIQNDSEYESGFRDQWRYLDNQAVLEYQKARGQ